MEDQNNSSRRDFLKKSSLAGMGLSATFLSYGTESETKKKERGILSEVSKKLMAQFNLKYPIFQAAPGGEALDLSN